MRGPVAISLVAHVAVLALLAAPAVTGPAPLVAVMVFDHHAPPGPTPAAAPPRRQPRPRAIPSHRLRQARALPAPVAPPVAQPAPEPTPPAAAPDPAPEPALPDVPGPASDEPSASSLSLGPAASAAARPDLSRDPDLEPGSCTRGLEYPPAVKQIRSEVIVRLRVILDDRGRVSDVRVVERAGDDFDETAMRAVRERCRFTAALDDHGRPVPSVIEDYRFHFQPHGWNEVGHFIIQ